jgi:hypothetical protein
LCRFVSKHFNVGESGALSDCCVVLQALLAIGDSCFNGTDKAVLYESLAELGLGSDALKGESHATFIAQVTESVASIAGGYLAVGVSLKFAIICTSVPYVISSVLTLFILETVRSWASMTLWVGSFDNNFWLELMSFLLVLAEHRTP